MVFNKTYIITGLLVILSCCLSFHKIGVRQSQDRISRVTVNSDDLRLDQIQGLVFLGDKAFTGICEKNDAYGNLLSKTFYVKGKKHGLHQKFFYNQELSFESMYSDGKLQGNATSWWSNGNKRTVSHYENGLAQGIQLQWYKSGQLFKKINLVDGKESGLQQSWRENGKLYNNYEVHDGRVYGLKRSKLCFKLDNENVSYAQD